MASIFCSSSFWSPVSSVTGMPGNLPFSPRKATAVSAGRLSTKAFSCCLASSSVVDLVGQDRLLPEDVAGMMHFLVEAAGGVAVEDRAAEGDVRSGVAVGPQRHVPAGQYELELVAAGLAEDGDALLGAPLLAAGVVLELLDEAGVPVGIDDALEDVVDDRLLFLGVEIAADVRLGVICQLLETWVRSKPRLGSLVIPVEADRPSSARRSAFRRGP